MKAAALAPLALVWLAAPARAHRLEIDCRQVSEGRIRLEVYYSDGKPAAGAEVVARAAGGAEVARGLTDSRGVFEFSHPPGMPLEVEARDDGAHRARISFVSGEAPAGGSAPVREAASRGAPRWGRLITGLAVIAALAVIARRVLRRRRAP